MTRDDMFSAMKKHAESIESYINSPEYETARIARIGELVASDHNCLSWWFPRIQAAGLPVPRTSTIVTTCNLIRLLDGETPADFDSFITLLGDEADKIGWPVFLRTGQGSGKHQWKDTCFVPNREALQSHVAALVEWSECVDMLGLPYHAWAVREMLPTRPVCKLTAYRDMPLCREFRFFTEGGKVKCFHPYWPLDSVEQGTPDNPDWQQSAIYSSSSTELEHLTKLAERAALACIEEDWSIDFLWTERSWYLTDMAIAAISYHWESCPNATQSP